MHYDFAPDADRARQLDRLMFVGLGESLRHLSEEHGRLTPLGRRLMQGVSAYMAGVS